ncbi:hypothetical protein CC99x_000125 [Candidatus Berkiella cookevillensis]|uniref:Uncharacterized protein n=1 Tax=Candidatus Berkiella cookevillensis TaxID=437022 RepID=A0A0Q9YE99_9GAMM|nr:hypothetical protein [Candidatus Berkiella cookevillensis]MCS5707301.1 hypothetical protein [Candidatus Berkiella cookevillensis]
MSLEEALKQENINRIQEQLLENIAPKARSKGEPFCWTDNYLRRKISDHFNSAVLDMSGNWDGLSEDAIIRDGINFVIHNDINTVLGRYFLSYAQNVSAYVREIQTSKIESMNITVQDLFIDPAHLHYSYKRAEIATLKIAKIEVIRWLAGLIQDSNTIGNKVLLNTQLETALNSNTKLSFAEKTQAFFDKIKLLSTDLRLFYRRSSHNNVSQNFENAWSQLQLIAHAGNQYDFSVGRALKVWGFSFMTGLKLIAFSPLRLAMFVHKMFDTWTGMPINSMYSAMNAYTSVSILKPAVDTFDLTRRAILPFAEGALLIFLVPVSLIPYVLMPMVGACAASVCMNAYSIYTGVQSISRYIAGGRLEPETQARGSIDVLLTNPSMTSIARIIAMLKYQHPELMAILSASEIDALIAQAQAAQHSGGVEPQADDVVEAVFHAGQLQAYLIEQQPIYGPGHAIALPGTINPENVVACSEVNRLR